MKCPFPPSKRLISSGYCSEAKLHLDKCSESLGVTQTNKLIFHAKLNLDNMHWQGVDIALVIALHHLLLVSTSYNILLLEMSRHETLKSFS